MSDEELIEVDNELVSYLTLETRFTRVTDKTFMPSVIKIKCEIMYAEDEDFPEHMTSVAFNKVKFWFDHYVTGSVVFCRDNDYASSIFVQDGKQVVKNTMILAPDEPSDGVLSALFLSKMNALANGCLWFTTLEIESNKDGLNFLFLGNPRSALPTPEQWLGDRNYFTVPWWERDDSSSIDVIPPDDDDLSVIPAFAKSLDFLADLYHTDEQEERIIRPFNPTIIDGGKDGNSS